MTSDDVLKEFDADELARLLPPHLAESIRNMADRIVELQERLVAVEAERDALRDQLAAVNVCYGNETSGRLLAERERDRAERTLAALRDPGDEIVDVMAAIAWDDSGVIFSTYAAKAMTRAAVTAAEKEVNDG